MPAFLIPIYQRASDAYGLGPPGPAILAAINEIETGFGANLGPSSAGAVGWMQFMPATWAAYGVDADGDGAGRPLRPRGRDPRRRPLPERLRRAGGPRGRDLRLQPRRLVRRRRARQRRPASAASATARSALSLIPKRQQLICTPRRRRCDARSRERYLRRLPERRRPLRARRGRRLGAGRRSPGSSPTTAAAMSAERAARPRGPLGIDRLRTGSASRSTATATARCSARAPATPRRPWPG